MLVFKMYSSWIVAVFIDAGRGKLPFHRWHPRPSSGNSRWEMMMAIERQSRILLLVQLFPPWRTEPNTAHMVKYLGRAGCRVDVVHSLPGWGMSQAYLSHDEELEAQLPHMVRRFPRRTPNLLRGLLHLLHGYGAEAASRTVDKPGGRSLFGRLLRSVTHIPDSDSFWFWPALREGLRLLRLRDHDLLLTSGPPFTTHLVGRLIKALTGIPWVCHHRDLYRDNPLYHPPMAWRHGLDRTLERWVISGADGVTTVYPEATELLRRRYGRPGQIYRTIRNGYDEEDFSWAKARIEREGINGDQPFVFLHGGRLAAVESRGRTAHSLLAGFQRWLERRPELRSRVRLDLVGNVAHEYNGIAEQRGLTDVVNIDEPVLMREMIRRELTADCLLVILEDDPKNWFTAGGKIYECARAGRPVLGILPENAAARLIRELNLGLTAPYADDAAVAERLDELYCAVTGGGFDYGGPARDEFVRKTSFAELAAEFIRVFRQVLDR
ncbi:MAG: glycosyltransferase [Candidatus Coatesbacteria bacterium]|nr:glycosyltransferase [Candidatus Coatesbacteria bacterium]